MNETFIKNVIEAALLAAGRPLTIAEIGQLFDELTRPGTAEIRAALEALAADYTERGIEVKETANGFRIQVKRDLANEISRLWPERPPKYSRALLETLALIAYRQPITRAEIEAVRGVAVNPNIVKTLLERNWVKVVGQRDVPGRPELLGTTKDFLDYFGLRSLDELPPLSELKAMGDVNLQLDLSKDSVAELTADSSSAAAAGLEGVDAARTPDADANEAAAAIAGGTQTAAVASDDGATDADAGEADAVGFGAAMMADGAEEAAAVASHDDANDAGTTTSHSDAAGAIDTDASSNGSDAAKAGGARKAPARRSRKRAAASASDNGLTDDANDAVAEEGLLSGAATRGDSSDAEGSGESPAVGEGADSDVKRADAAVGEDVGPKVRAAQAFVAEMESEDANGSDDDDDELSEGDRQGSSELVASPPFNYED